MWVNKFHDETETASFPDNPIAHDSVVRYLEAPRSVCIHVAERRRDGTCAQRRSASPATILISRK